MKNYKILDSFHLKIIALVSMFIDHFAATLLTFLVNASYTNITNRQLGEFRTNIIMFINKKQDIFQNMVLVMRIIGRMAFPIYCFLLVQGFTYTKNKWKYVLRLLIFAFVSEWPFDMAFNKLEYMEFKIYNNVFFTLLLGFIFMWLISYIQNIKVKICSKCNTVSKIGFNIVYICVILFVGVLIFLLSKVFVSDYGIAGIICILLMYLFRKYAILSYVLGTLAIWIVSLNEIQLYALLGIIPIIMYNGQKGKSVKWLFYIFYPAHLMILLILSMCMGVYNI